MRRALAWTGAGCVAALALLAASAPAHAAGNYVLRTPYWHAEGSRGDITSLRFDAAGKGRYGPGLVLRFGPETNVTDAAPWRADARTGAVTCGPVTAVASRSRERKEDHTVSLPLEAGGSVGQTLRTTADGLCYAGVLTPTWLTKDSAVTLQVRRGGPGGDVIARQRFENVLDNGWIGFSFRPQPASDYFIELVEPKGKIGAWAQSGNPRADGEAVVDGQARPDLDLCVEVGYGDEIRGSVRIAADGSRLVYEFAPEKPGGATPQLALVHPWQSEGYDISPATTPFRAYETDEGQYIPAQQLKRRACAELSLQPRKWLGLLGTGAADLQVAVSGDLEPQLAPSEVTLRLPQARVEITGRPRGDGWLPFQPRFLTPDAAFTRDWNDFLRERAFSYPPVKNKAIADWMEWRGRTIYWMNLPGLWGGELPWLLSYWMADDGYVYTWGASPEWPFPDNAKYDARHFTTNAGYILACWRAYCWSGDRAFLAQAMPRVRRAMEWQITTCRGADGLFIDNSPDHDGTTRGSHSNYWDDIPFGYQSPYENVYFYASLSAMAELEEAASSLSGAEAPAQSAAEARPSPAPRPAQYYRNLAETVHRRYDEAFWQGERYIATVDITGARHDFGITYVSMEALAYGLGDADKARAFYRWMAGVVCDSGKADMYAFAFAPRVNAWDLSKTWWYLDGKDVIPRQAYATHLENGGAILYTSHFDLLARARGPGADDALARATAILERWREPDHLCGGAPLSRGENNGWQVGTDIPFPESGLAPVAPLYCFLGVEARADGLHIRPNLPTAWPWLKVTNVRWRGMVMDIGAARQAAGYRVVVTVRAPEANRGEKTWTVPVGGQVTLVTPLRGSWPPPEAGPAGAWQASWIWMPGQGAEAGPRCFARKVFDVTAAPARATLQAAADNEARVYLDGRDLGRVSGWAVARGWDVTRLLRPGRHVLALAGANGGGPAGLLAQVTVTDAKGRKSVVVGTGTDWKVSADAADGWTKVGFDDGVWQAAAMVAPVGGGPWGPVEQAPVGSASP